MPISQITIPAVEKMPALPSPLFIRDWRQVALDYDTLVFDFEQQGDFLPLIWWDKTHSNFPRDTFGLYSYVGSMHQGHGAHHEAINCAAAVLGATLVGIDKSCQHGHNWVLMCENYFNRDNGENLFLNQTVSESGRTFWYELFTHLLIYALIDYYPQTGHLIEEMEITADMWYEAAYVMAQEEDFNYTAFDFKSMQPVYNGRWREPDGAAGIAWIQYMAYVRFGNPKYLEAAKWALDYLQERTANPYYEVLLPYGAMIAARMNKEVGTDYDVAKFLNWCCDGDSESRPGWGVVTERWGGVDCHGLTGSLTDGNGYAFAMNSFQSAAALVPLVRYGPQFARAIGRWMLNLANNARLFYADFHPHDHQTCWFWQGDPKHLIPYEGLRKEWDGKSPYATGDPIRYSWGAIDFCLYAGSHVGMLGGLMQKTNVEGILQWDCLKTDYFKGESNPTFLYYNPYPEEKRVEIPVGSEVCHLYDLTVDDFIERNVTGLSHIIVPPDTARVVVIVPAQSRVYGKE